VAFCEVTIGLPHITARQAKLPQKRKQKSLKYFMGWVCRCPTSHKILCYNKLKTIDPMNTEPTPSPDAVLSDVPPALRRQVYVRCSYGFWQDAHDLLHQNGYTQYSLEDLRAFYHPDREGVLQTAPVRPAGPACVSPAPPPSSPVAASPACGAKPAPRSRKRRSKISKLPKTLRLQLNTMLDDGATYDDIIQWLEGQGRPGFNHTNLRHWKNGGYLDWLEEEERRDQDRSLRQWAATLAKGDDPRLLGRALTNFSAARLHRLLATVNLNCMADHLSGSPEYCARFFNALLRTAKMSLEFKEPESTPKGGS
jgi:hypothetical protein